MAFSTQQRQSTSAFRLCILSCFVSKVSTQGMGLIQAYVQPDETPQELEGAISAKLNSHNFGGNVLRGEDEQPQNLHWVVNFCLDWWQPCQNIAAPFELLAQEWEGKLNGDLLTNTVRFATVNCATDKVLCNEQDVSGYPSIFHYTGGQNAAKWVGGRKNDEQSLRKWLFKQLDGISLDGRNGTAATPEATEEDEESTGTGFDHFCQETMKDLLLVAISIAASTRLVLSNASLGQTAGESQPVSRIEVAAEEEKEGECRGVAGALPQEWASTRTLEL